MDQDEKDSLLEIQKIGISKGYNLMPSWSTTQSE